MQHSYESVREGTEMKIRIAILGYGNLGRGVHCAIRQNAEYGMYQ